uniref:2-oxoacid oxidoreductase (ferredoxin) n=1 Tax=Fervidicoccus fontis TaxID=683846 RepID=A0A7J3ZL68_9CREN
MSSARVKPVPPEVIAVPRREVWHGARAVAEAARIADVDVIAAYPIRPYTGIMNALAKMIADGELQAEFIVADSEHTQFEVVKHASTVGARTMVGSSGVGMIFATEAIVVTALAQCPVVAIAGCRALDDPGNFGMEWNDTLMYRDFPWIIVWPKHAEEALDAVVVSYRVGEDHRVLLPTFVALDGSVVTHVSVPVNVPDAERIRKHFLPPYKPPYPLDPDFGPVTKAQHVAPSLIGPEQRKVLDVAMKRAYREVIPEAWKLYNEIAGRDYPVYVEEFFMEDAEIALVTMGAYTSTAVTAAKRLREKGIKVGVVRSRYFRPFPYEELRKSLEKENVRGIGVLDFSYSIGSPNFGGVLYTELRSALYDADIRPLIIDFLFLGGREPGLLHFMKAAEIVKEAVDKGRVEKPVYWLTLKGEDI